MSNQFSDMLHNHYDLTPTIVETHAVPEKGYTVTTVTDVMPNYDTRTSTDRIDEINRELSALRAELRAISERMQGER